MLAFLHVEEAGLSSTKRWGRDMGYFWRWFFSFFQKNKKHGWGRDIGNSWRCSN
jgi:hypothetical protein